MTGGIFVKSLWFYQWQSRSVKVATLLKKKIFLNIFFCHEILIEVDLLIILEQCFLTFFDGDPISNSDRSWQPKLLLLPVYHSCKLYSNGIAKENILY